MRSYTLLVGFFRVCVCVSVASSSWPSFSSMWRFMAATREENTWLCCRLVYWFMSIALSPVTIHLHYSFVWFRLWDIICLVVLFSAQPRAFHDLIFYPSYIQFCACSCFCVVPPSLCPSIFERFYSRENLTISLFLSSDLWCSLDFFEANQCIYLCIQTVFRSSCNQSSSTSG